MIGIIIKKSRLQKTCLWGFRPGCIHTGLYSLKGADPKVSKTYVLNKDEKHNVYTWVGQ